MQDFQKQNCPHCKSENVTTRIKYYGEGTFKNAKRYLDHSCKSCKKYFDSIYDPLEKEIGENISHGEVMALYSAESRCDKSGCSETDMDGSNKFIFHAGLFLCQVHGMAAMNLFGEDNRSTAFRWAANRGMVPKSLRIDVRDGRAHWVADDESLPIFES